jgi:hypothetical protein
MKKVYTYPQTEVILCAPLTALCNPTSDGGLDPEEFGRAPKRPAF